MERIASWGTIGTATPDAKTISDVLVQSGLDYTVRKCNLFTTLSEKSISHNNAIGLKNVVATVNERDGSVLGIVGKNYEVCQNSEAFDFVNYIDSDVKFERAGQTKGGLVYVIASLPQVTVMGDTFTPYVIFQNGHNGGITIKATICPLRIVCQNQFNIAFRHSPNTVSIKHTSSMQDKLIDARNVLAKSAEYMRTLTEESEKYAGMKLSDGQISAIIEDMFPIKADMSDRTKNRIELERSRFRTAYASDDNSNFRNSVWGLINAESDYLTHRAPVRMTENWDDKHFYVATFDPTAMMRLIEMATARVAA